MHLEPILVPVQLEYDRYWLLFVTPSKAGVTSGKQPWHYRNHLETVLVLLPLEYDKDWLLFVTPAKAGVQSGKQPWHYRNHLEGVLVLLPLEYDRYWLLFVTPTKAGVQSEKQPWHCRNHLARLVQLGARQARYFGRTETLFQLLMAATVANLTLVAGKVGRWAEPTPKSPLGPLTALLQSSPQPGGTPF